MNAGEKIKELRIQNKMTLEELGKKCGVGKSTVRKWENGMIKNMGRDKIEKLSEALGVSTDYIIKLNEDEKPTLSIRELNKEEKELIELFRQLPDTDRKAAVLMIHSLLESKGLLQRQS